MYEINLALLIGYEQHENMLSMMLTRNQHNILQHPNISCFTKLAFSILLRLFTEDGKFR